MRKRVSASVGVMVVVVALVLGTFGARAQMPGMGPPIQAMGRAMCNIEGLWGEVTFTAKVSDETLLKIRPDFQKAVDERDKLTAEMASPQDVIASLDKLDEIADKVVDAVKKALTEEEFGKVSSWFQQRKFMRDMISQGGGAPGGPPRQQQQ